MVKALSEAMVIIYTENLYENIAEIDWAVIEPHLAWQLELQFVREEGPRTISRGSTGVSPRFP